MKNPVPSGKPPSAFNAWFFHGQVEEGSGPYEKETRHRAHPLRPGHQRRQRGDRGKSSAAQTGHDLPIRPKRHENTRTRLSRAYAIAIVAIAGGLAWWAWYELIRSPYLTRGYMTLELQFRLPPGTALPPEATDVHITMEEGRQYSEVTLGRSWHGTDGDRRAILAHASLSMKASRRVVHLELPGVAEQTWQVDLPSDPDPTPGYSPWRLSSSGASAPKIEMNFHLSADH